MIGALVLHRKTDGMRVIVFALTAADGHDWPWVETFDEVANALNAQHVIEDSEAVKRSDRGQRAPGPFRRPPGPGQF